MSGWEIRENRFIDCMAGSFIGGGRDNHIHDNYYENCDLAQHFDNRGMNWEQNLCNCTNGSVCDPAVASSIVADPASAKYVSEYPEIKVKNRVVLRHFMLKTIILPRQARDKHRESTQKRGAFFLTDGGGWGQRHLRARE